MLLIPLLAFGKNKEFSIGIFLKRNIIFIAAAILGFIYPIIAQLYVSYYFLVYLSLLVDAIINKEKEEKADLGSGII